MKYQQQHHHQHLPKALLIIVIKHDGLLWPVTSLNSTGTYLLRCM
jgi:hypothetical protein